MSVSDIDYDKMCREAVEGEMKRLMVSRPVPVKDREAQRDDR